MRLGALLFVAALAGSAAGWALLVLPVRDEAAAAARRMESADVAGAWSRATSWPGPTADEARRLEESLSHLAPPPPAGPPPAGIRPEDAEGGAFAGTILWAQVQDLLAWASSRPERLLSLQVAASPDDPDRARCRVVFSEEARR